MQEANIGIRYKSDHNPISIALKFVDQERGRGNWKFNNSLLRDTEYVELINSCIKETVNQYKINCLEQENPNPSEVQFSVNDQLFWETLKLMIRGKTISYATYQRDNLYECYNLFFFKKEYKIFQNFAC